MVWRTSAAFALAFAAMTTVGATGAHADPAATRSVGLFDRACYAMMPDISGTEEVATEGKWEPVVGSALDAFLPAVKPDVIKAWKFEAEGETFSVAVTQSPMDDQAKMDYPKYAGATNFACSLVLPSGPATSDAIGSEMEKLLERKADENYEEGPWKVSTWGGGNDKLFVLLYHYAPKAAPSGGLLSMTVFQNP